MLQYGKIASIASFPLPNVATQLRVYGSAAFAFKCVRIFLITTGSSMQPACIASVHLQVPRNRRNGSGNTAPSRSNSPPPTPGGSGSAVHPREYGPFCLPGLPVRSSPPVQGNRRSETAGPIPHPRWCR